MKLLNLLAASCLVASAASGDLSRITPDGRTLECPLKHTAVKANISGPMATVVVRQDFVNDSSDTIEAVYNFPLPVLAAVHGYEIHVNDRVIKGKIARREDAQRAYDESRRRGQTAALLNQQRPNVFQQFIANITPGAKVSVEVQYVELVPYESTTYQFTFPMVVGPRYKAGADINPPMAPRGTRPGHDISLEVRLAMATEIGAVLSESHAIKQTRHNQWFETIQLADAKEIPNKDFLLKYRVASRGIAPSLLTHRTGNEGYFSFVLDPPGIRPDASSIAPKELVFVIDTSGSMHGFPLDKAKEAMLQAIHGLHPRDTFNLITFSGDTDILWPRPVLATPENIAKAKQFLMFKNGGGGTEMMKAIRAALDDSDSQEHLRVVCFMTDGYVGNDNEIIAEIRKHSNARVFSFGIGSSVNRFLLDKMAEAGRGDVEYVSLNSDGSAAARRFHERVRNPLLTDITIDFNGLPVTDVVPARIPDLFSAKPIVVSGRYAAAAQGRIRIRGRIGAQPYERWIDVRLPDVQSENSAVPLIWARRQIDALSIDSATNREAITQLGLKHSLMTAFTSYYAIDDRIVNEGGISRHVPVPVASPEGVKLEMVADNAMAMRTFAPAPISKILAQIKVRILLKQSSTALLEKLKLLGFLPDPAPAGARFLTGSIDARRLEELRRLDGVTRVEEIQ